MSGEEIEEVVLQAAAQGLMGEYRNGLILIQKAAPSQRNQAIEALYLERIEVQEKLAEDIKNLKFPLETGKQFQLKDGRILGYEIYGHGTGENVHTSGLANLAEPRILLFFHGTPGCRLFFTNSWNAVAMDKQITVYVIERPGFGLSSPQPNRTLLSFAEDVKEFVEGMNFKKVAILGYSGGGPYALACAHVFPDLIRSVVLVSSPSPPETPNYSKGMPFYTKLASFLARSWYWPLKLAVTAEIRQVLKDPIRTMTTSLSCGVGDGQACMTNPAIERAFVLSTLDVYSRQGCEEAEAMDFWLFSHPWGFKLPELSKDIQYFVFYGLEDTSVVPSMGEYLSKTLPNCKAEVFKQMGHLLIFEIWPDVIGMAFS